jgi:hypothetical protein
VKFQQKLDSILYKLAIFWENKRISKKKAGLFLIIVILLGGFLFQGGKDNDLILQVQAAIVKQDDSVDSDSDIDSIGNYGDDGATSYLDAQTLDGTDQVIDETITGGGGGSSIKSKISQGESYPQWTSNGKLSEAGGGKMKYSSLSGQRNVQTDNGYEPYIYFSNNNTVKVGGFSIEFRSQEQGGYQIITNSTTSEVEIEDQRFELQYWREQGGGSWRVIDLWLMDIEVSTADNDTTFPKLFVKRVLSDGEGNELNITYSFTPKNTILLRFDLKVQDEDQYQIRFQSTGIAGDTIITNTTNLIENVTGGLQFDNIKFSWSFDESDNRTWEIEQQAGGKKVDIFLGNYSLSAGGNITIFPDTWGATETSDDCFSVRSTYYDSYDAGDGDQLGVGVTTGIEVHAGWIWSNVEADGTAEAGSFIRVYGGTRVGDTPDAYLAASTDDTPTAWSTDFVPPDITGESTTIDWDEDGTGTQDSPEIYTMIQDRFDNNHDSGDSMALVWISLMDSGTHSFGWNAEDGSPGNGAELTIVFTPTNYRLEWEHQCSSVPYTVMDSFNITLYGFSTDSEDYQIQLWNDTSSDWINTSVYIEQSETWYNFSIDNYSGVVGSTITWRYLDNITINDLIQGSLSIDYAGIAYWNYSVNLIEATISLDSYNPGTGWEDFTENPLELNISSFFDYDIEIRGTDGTGNPVTNEYLRFDTDSDPIGGTNLTSSWQVIYNDQSAGITQHLFYLFVSSPFGATEQSYTFTLYVRLLKA